MTEDKNKPDVKAGDKPSAVERIRGMVSKPKPGSLPANEETVDVRAAKTVKARVETGDVDWLVGYYANKTPKNRVGGAVAGRDDDGAYDIDESDNSFIWVTRAYHSGDLTDDEYDMIHDSYMG